MHQELSVMYDELFSRTNNSVKIIDDMVKNGIKWSDKNARNAETLLAENVVVMRIFNVRLARLATQLPITETSDLAKVIVLSAYLWGFTETCLREFKAHDSSFWNNAGLGSFNFEFPDYVPPMPVSGNNKQ